MVVCSVQINLDGWCLSILRHMSQDTKFKWRLGTPQYHSFKSGTGVIFCGQITAYRDINMSTIQYA